MLKIRLKRMGAKKAPFYRFVVADSRSPRDGRFVEEIGYYNPIKNPIILQVDLEKANDWIRKGAQATDTVKSLLRKAAAAPAGAEPVAATASAKQRKVARNASAAAPASAAAVAEPAVESVVDATAAPAAEPAAEAADAAATPAAETAEPAAEPEAKAE